MKGLVFNCLSKILKLLEICYYRLCLWSYFWKFFLDRIPFESSEKSAGERRFENKIYKRFREILIKLNRSRSFWRRNDGEHEIFSYSENDYYNCNLNNYIKDKNVIIILKKMQLTCEFTHEISFKCFFNIIWHLQLATKKTFRNKIRGKIKRTTQCRMTQSRAFT